MRLRSIAVPAVVLALLGGGLWLLAQVVAGKMRSLGIEPGFDFLAQRAGFDIGDRIIEFDAADSYARAFGVGLLNTVRVAVLAIAASLLLGGLLGLGQLGRNRLLARLCEAYVELFRNVPLLLQLLIVYTLLLGQLPLPHEAWSPLPGVWLSKSGLALPWLGAGGIEYPQLGRYTFSGGLILTPEFMAVALGLTLFTSAYIAETVRGSVQAVARGQGEAARALGLNERDVMRHVVLPQALRSMIPPLANQLLNLIKNASLAVVVGYPELVAIADTALNQSGHAVECIAIIMAVYLALSLITALLMGLWHARLLQRQGAV